METTQSINRDDGFLLEVFTSLRIIIFSILICCVAYPTLILMIGSTLTPHSASGSLVRAPDGRVLGSEGIAQDFSKPEYFWTRPSAVDFNASGAGGSNLSPASAALRARVEGRLKTLAASPPNPAPTDLVTASGSGLDPDITLEAARYQADRVAKARGLRREEVDELIDSHARRPGGVLTSEPVVNVLALNLALSESR